MLRNILCTALKIRVLFVLGLMICFCANSLKAQTPDTLVVWKAGRPLQWNDFNGPIDYTSSFEATTYTSMRYVYTWRLENGTYHIVFKTHGYMHTNTSWSHVNKQTDYLLGHEQLHFDITELFARKLLEAYKAETFDPKAPDLKQKIARICTEMEVQRNAMQKRYDEETNHCKNHEAQHSWEQYIKAELALTKPSD